ncbi:hypothetical protein V7S43_009458 [Phytophthora oleae]|uniref:Uncharacterized protein n=1 Tax=Phytophthora oleae TaxID=2107226 RepID=A0ABD3FHP5_9STRA
MDVRQGNCGERGLGSEDFDGDLEFKTVDLLGDRPSANPKLKVVLKEVEEKTGWHRIKEEMKNLVRISDENYERELKGQETVPLCLNRLFLGVQELVRQRVLSTMVVF